MKYDTTDVWDYLSRTTKPVVLYGTGDGADKILTVFERYHIKTAGVFASDGFVRDRFFHDMKVMSYADIAARYNNFIIIVAFASCLDGVLENIYNLAEKHELYAPDVPVSGGELFCREFYDRHETELDAARSLLCDTQSADVFDNVIRYKLSGDISYLRHAQCDRDEVWSTILSPRKYRGYADLGAYNGDTVEQLFRLNPDLERIYAMEPDLRSFKKLRQRCEDLKITERTELYNLAAWNENIVLPFSAKGNRSSGVESTGKIAAVNADSLDNILNGKKVDYIKYDVEGAESTALNGSAKTISRYRPDLCVSLYHRSEDIFKLILQVHTLNPSYRLYLRRFPYIPAWDLNLYAVERSGDAGHGSMTGAKVTL